MTTSGKYQNTENFCLLNNNIYLILINIIWFIVFSTKPNYNPLLLNTLQNKRFQKKKNPKNLLNIA